MSRRAPNPAADRAAQNAATIKNLLKLEANKTCADCKKNKHPRWASWNLGIFICIRCSGIHRGMGTHISRVKSVDLDAWTDEQLQSVLNWGNSRANKYWEAKLAPGHVPSDAKIENFIRTKYDTKRWTMDGPIPDPSTLDDEGDDDIPLSIVKEKNALERSASQKAASTTSTGSAIQPPPYRRTPQPDLFGDSPGGSPSRSLSAAPSAPASVRPQEPAQPPRQTKPADSLLGLDFGDQAPPPNRPLSAAANPGVQSRPDLKQSILSLYATASRPQQPAAAPRGSISGVSQPAPNQQQSSFGGLNDAFSSLSFSATSPPPQQTQSKPSAFSGLGDLSSHRSTPSVTSPPSNLGGGSFFDIKPSQPTSQPTSHQSQGFSSSGFGAFNLPPATQPAPVVSASSGLGDLFDFSTPAPQAAPIKQALASPPIQQSSVFNLSAKPAAPPAKAQAAPVAVSGWSNSSDAWASDDAWATATPAAAQPPPTQASSGSFGWGSGGLSNQSIVPGGAGGFAPSNVGPPKVSADEEFGGWSSAAPETPVSPGIRGPPASKPATSFSTGDDLFSNVWE